MGGGGWTIDSISMTTNTLKHNNSVLQVPIPFQGLKSPCRYLQITALCKAALSGAICQWPQGREKTEGNRHKQASEKCNGFCWGFSHCCGSVGVSFVYQMYKIHWEIVNIKGLSSLWRLLTGDLFMTFNKGGGIHDGFSFAFQGNPCHWKKTAAVSGLRIYCCHQYCAALPLLSIT